LYLKLDRPVGHLLAGLSRPGMVRTIEYGHLSTTITLDTYLVFGKAEACGVPSREMSVELGPNNGSVISGEQGSNGDIHYRSDS